MRAAIPIFRIRSARAAERATSVLAFSASMRAFSSASAPVGEVLVQTIDVARVVDVGRVSHDLTFLFSGCAGERDGLAEPTTSQGN
jgi:hypothetical protein